MTTATINITFGDFQSETQVSSIDVAITDQNGAHQGQTVAQGTATVTFSNVQPGQYMASAQAKDISGNNVGPAATATFDVQQPSTITVSIPVSLSISVQ